MRARRRARQGGGTLFVLGWDLQNLTDGVGGPRPAEVLYSVDDLVGAIDGLQVVRAERVRQAGSSHAVDTLLTATRNIWSGDALGDLPVQ